MMAADRPGPSDERNSFHFDPPIVLGVAGGVASGKSTVAAMLAELGFCLLDADQIGRDLVRDDPRILDAIAKAFGPGVLDAAGRLDRGALAAIVFDDPAALRRLEAITHPAIRNALEAGLDGALAAGHSVVLDIPLLFEGGWAERCHHCIFVETDNETRRARASARGWDDGELARREAQQIDLSVKKNSCAYRVRTRDDLQSTRAEVTAVLARIARDHAR